MSYQEVVTGLSDVRGTHHENGSAFIYFVRGGDSSQSGIYRLLKDSVLKAAEGQGQPISVRGINFNRVGSNDVQWVGANLVARFGTKLWRLEGVTDLDSVTPEQLLAIAWDDVDENNSLPEPASAEGAVYAARVPSPNDVDFSYVKLRIYDGSEVAARIDWAMYMVDARPWRVAEVAGDWYDLSIDESESTILLSGTTEDGFGAVMILERSVEGPYPRYESSLAYEINGGPLVNPRQMVVDDFSVYVVDSTSLWRINSLSGSQVELVQNIGGGVGLLLDTDVGGTTAYISNLAGELYRINLSDHDLDDPVTPTVSIGGQSGFMRWSFEDRSSILVTEQTQRRIVRVDLQDGAVDDEIDNLSFTPWSVESISPTELYIAAEEEIGVSRRVIETNPGLVVLGIGLVPWQLINGSDEQANVNDVNNGFSLDANTGRADTSSVEGYYFWRHPNIPFGGELSLQLNHEEAYQQGYREYRIFLQSSRYSLDYNDLNLSFVNLRWDPGASAFVREARSPGDDGWFQIPDPSELYYNPFLAAIIRTNTSLNGHNVVRFEFRGPGLDNDEVERVVLIDNTRYSTKLRFPRLGATDTPPAPGAYPTLDCGCIGYESKDDRAEFDFAAWYPQSNAGDYLMQFFRGGTHLTSLSQSGPVTRWQSVAQDLPEPPETPWSSLATTGTNPLRIGHLLESCDIGNIRVVLSVSSRVTNGFGWVSLSARSERSFTLAPNSALANSPWTDPG